MPAANDDRLEEVPDLRVAERHVLTLTGDCKATITLQVFDDGPQKRHELAQIRSGTIADLWPWVCAMQARGCGVFCTVNQTTGQGRKTADVTRVRALFVDFDGAEPGSWHVAPSIIVQSRAGKHAYWLVDDCELAGFARAQKLLACHYGSDPQVHDLPRVMRLPGTLHQKGPESFKVKLLHASRTSYPLALVLAGLNGAPSVPTPARRPGGDRARRSSSPTPALDAARSWLATRAPAVEGNGGDQWTYATAAQLVIDFALSDEEALEVLLPWNARCRPPWTIEELTAKVRNARQYGHHDPGQALIGVVKSRPCTDLGNAERLADQHGPAIRFVEDRRNWFTWTGTHWKRGAEGPVNRFAAETVRCIPAEAAALSDEPEFIKGQKAVGDSPRAKMLKWAKASESRERLAAMIALAQHEPRVACSADDFDRDPYQLCTPTGVIDLRSGIATPNAPEQLLSRITNAAFDPAARSPVWEEFLEQITCGDGDLRAYLQRAVGLTLVGEQREHVFFFCFGSGLNGKSTFLNAILYALGDYGTALPPDLLIEKRFASHPTELADLEGARMAVGTEVPTNASWDEVRIKSLTGADLIEARTMRKDFYEFAPSHTFWVSGNNKPNIMGKDDGIWRRVVLIPFLARLAKDKVDRDLPAKLRAREAMAAILAWAVQGAKNYLAQGLGTCAAVDDATADYRQGEDRMGQFLAECCVQDGSCQVSKKTMRKAMQDWFGECGYATPSDKAVLEDFRRRNIRDGQTHAGDRVWRGVGLRQTGPMGGGACPDD